MISGPATRALVLYWYPGGMRPAIRHHLRALDYAKGPCRVFYCNVANGSPRWLRHLDFDAVILHTTFLCLRWNHLFAMWKWKTRWVRELPTVKIAIPQDEYDHAEILDEWLAELGVSVIMTNFDEEKRELFYPIMSKRASFRQHFTGYIDETTARRCAERMLPMEARPNDIVYRAAHLPYWFGRHGQLKHRIADMVAERARTRWGLTCDVSTKLEDGIVGNEWFDFLMSGRVVIGCETGSSVLDRRGEVKAAIQKILRDEPLLSFEEVSARLPTGWDRFEFFAIGPRHFEAVITKTCQVLTEGHYDGVLEPGRHYLPLKRDFSNLDEVLERIKDVELVTRVAEQAYQDIYLSGRYTYRRLADDVEAVLLASPPRTGRRRQFHVEALWKAAYSMSAAQRVGGAAAWPVLRRARPLLGLAGASRRAIAMGLLTIRLALPSRPLRRILVAYLSDPEAARSVELDRVLADLLRVSILYRAQTGRLRTGWPFRVATGFDADTGRLTLTSWRVDSDGPRTGAAEEPDWGGLERALRAGRVRAIVWDHSALGAYVPYALTRARWLSIGLGERGVYRFTALVALAHRFPGQAVEALIPILRAEPPRRPLLGRLLRQPRVYMVLGLAAGGVLRRVPGLRRLVVALAHRFPGEAVEALVPIPRAASPRRPLLGRLLRQPRVYTALGLTVVGALRRVPGLRRLVVAYLRDAEARRAVSLDRVLADLLRLSLVQDVMARPARDPSTFRVRVTYEAERTTLTFRSAPVGHGPDDGARETEHAVAIRRGPLSRIVWDHSAIVNTVPCVVRGATPILISLGTNGVYEFTALGALAERQPEHIWPALIPSVLVREAQR